MYLICAPVPGGKYGETQGHAGPWQISSDGVSEQVHGVLTWQVAGAVGNDLAWHCHAVNMLQVAVATNLVKGCRPGTHISNNAIH